MKYFLSFLKKKLQKNLLIQMFLMIFLIQFSSIQTFHKDLHNKSLDFSYYHTSQVK